MATDDLPPQPYDDEDARTPGYLSWDEIDWPAVEYIQRRRLEVEALRGTPGHRAAAEELMAELEAADRGVG